jgi:glutathione synthase/RimK-type ligase-like ATP-grasp enzyme
MGNHVVLNHPDNIRNNRNKFKTLQTLNKANVNVAPFIEAGKVIAAIDSTSSPIKLPLIGRTNYHQGGKGLWTCLTKTMVQAAINEGAQYFQNFMDVKTEYRLHVFQGGIINAQKKVPRKNMEGAFVEQYGDRIKHNAEKAGKKIDEATMQLVLSDVGKRTLANPDQIVKSNTRGWKFSQVKTVPAALEKVAIDAVKAIGLDFGAVDCCILDNNDVAIIEVNTGPGLSGSSFDAYIAAFKEFLKPKKTVSAATKPKAAAAGASAAPSTGGGKKKVDPNALRNIADMLEHADDSEAEAINSVISKMFGS